MFRLSTFCDSLCDRFLYFCAQYLKYIVRVCPVVVEKLSECQEFYHFKALTIIAQDFRNVQWFYRKK